MRPLALAGAALALVALSACDGDPVPVARVAAAPVPALVAPVAPVAPAVAATAGVLTGPRGIGPALPASAGTLVGADVPGAAQSVALDVAFSGIEMGTGGDGARLVAYPWVGVTASADGTIVAHLKFPRFSCRPGVPLLRLTRSDCRSRTVAYGDADARSTTLDVDADGVATVEVTANAYRYGAGVDRAPGLSPQPTGERLTLRAVVQPGEVLSRSAASIQWRPLATVDAVAVTRAGRPPVRGTGSAPQDDGYANSYRSSLR